LGDILAAGGISALMKALRAHMDNPDVLLAGIELLAYLAQSDQLKTLIGLQGGIPVVLETTKNFPEHDLLQTRCWYRWQFSPVFSLKLRLTCFLFYQSCVEQYGVEQHAQLDLHRQRRRNR
jgi:hypothetical protein